MLGFLVLAWLGLLGIVALAPEIYDQMLRLSPVDRRPAELGFVSAITLFLAVLGVGVVRRWRWTIWLVLVAFLSGGLRAPVSLLEFAGVLPAAGPTWYLVVQAVLGLVQFGIGLLMLAGYRCAGVWAAPAG